MKARGPGSSWVKQNYDRLLIVVMLSLLLLSAVTLVLKVGQTRAVVSEASWENYAGPRKSATPLVTTNFDESLVIFKNPFQLAQQNQRFAVGELRVSCVKCGKPIPYDAAVCPFDGAPQPEVGVKRDSDGDFIPDEDEQKLGLNPQDPMDAQTDLDGDKYSNIEEYRDGTKINDAASHPTAIAKLRLSRAIVDPFRLRFLSVSKGPDGDRFQLNMRSLDRTYFAKMGQTVEGFVVTALDTNSAIPTLILTQGEKTYRLVQGKVINEDQLSAILVFILDGSTFKVRINETVKLPDKSYKVVDIKEDRVVVRNEDLGIKFTVPRLTEDERARLRQGGVGVVP